VKEVAGESVLEKVVQVRKLDLDFYLYFTLSIDA